MSFMDGSGHKELIEFVLNGDLHKRAGKFGKIYGMKAVIFIAALLCTASVVSETTFVDGRKVVCEDGVCMLVEETPGGEVSRDMAAEAVPSRIAHGYMDADRFVAFLQDDGNGNASPFDGKAWWLVALLVLLGGLGMNLTPCVLPMIPVNLMIVGRSASRGALYGAGIALAYGTLGILAAAGGMAFGEIQGNAWFNAAISVLFLVLSLAMFGAFFIDFSKKRNSMASMRNGMWPGFFAFFMGAVSAILAGACVAPILIAVLLLTADLSAKGVRMALALPFLLGVGMALPWPFAGAGLKVLPKPGAWMEKVGRIFGLVTLAFSAWYGYLAWTGFSARFAAGSSVSSADGEAQCVRISSPGQFNLDGLKLPVVVDCWASWCKNCSHMERTTLSDPRVKDALKAKGFTLVKLQCEDMAALKRTKGFDGVLGLPAFLIFEQTKKGQQQ